MLKTVEAEAGTPKTPFVFKTPIATAASATSRMNGNIICVKVVASAAFRAKPVGNQIDKLARKNNSDNRDDAQDNSKRV